MSKSVKPQAALWRHDGVELARWTETYSYDTRDRLVKACMSYHYFAYSNLAGYEASLSFYRASARPTREPEPLEPPSPAWRRRRRPGGGAR